jgi:hypothetical protein
MTTPKTEETAASTQEKVDENTKFGKFIMAKRARLAPFKMSLIIENKLLEGPDGAEVTKKALELKNLIDALRAAPDDQAAFDACNKSLDEYEPIVRAVFKKHNVAI